MTECGWCLLGTVAAVVLAGGFLAAVYWFLTIIDAGRPRKCKR
jgi:hypothetical protein